MNLTIESEACRCFIADKELVAVGRAIGERRSRILRLDAELVFSKLRHKTSVEELEKENTDDFRRLELGFDMKPTELLVLKFRPDSNQLIRIRLDTGRIHEQRDLRSEEKQLKLTVGKPPMYLFYGDFLTDEDTAQAVLGVPLTRAEAKRFKPLAEKGLVKIHAGHQRKLLAAAGGTK